jgi:hypothetical protein
MPDYSNQLEEIAKALNRPATPQWVIAALGFIGGIITQSLMMLMTDFHRRYEMRRVLYIDLVNMFWAVDGFTDIPQSERFGQKEQLKKTLLFRGEKHCLDNPEIYIQLSERRAGEMVYPYFHRILDDPQNGLNANIGLALSVFSQVVHDRTLKRMYLRLFLGRRGAATLCHSAEKYYRQDEKLLKRMRGRKATTEHSEELNDSESSK